LVASSLRRAKSKVPALQLPKIPAVGDVVLSVAGTLSMSLFSVLYIMLLKFCYKGKQKKSIAKPEIHRKTFE
jgi:hypothetical protein